MKKRLATEGITLSEEDLDEYHQKYDCHATVSLKVAKIFAENGKSSKRPLTSDKRLVTSSAKSKSVVKPRLALRRSLNSSSPKFALYRKTRMFVKLKRRNC
jgi:hypothetical protein